jgi:CHAT domain-containing protein
MDLPGTSRDQTASNPGSFPQIHSKFNQLNYLLQKSNFQSDELRPRLWWCPTGPFAELPLHAAGIYHGQEQDALANYVISSYTPTLSALISARSLTQTKSNTRPESGKVFAVYQSDVNSLSSLPNATVEVDALKRIVPSGSFSTLKEHEATVQNILAELPAAAVLHLACHGHQDPEDPLASGFSLQDGRLTLSQLMEVHIPDAQLAYLSACETASTDENQPDEAMNLAATMLFVGFKSVIATMWYVF